MYYGLSTAAVGGGALLSLDGVYLVCLSFYDVFLVEDIVPLPFVGPSYS